jgi:thiamine pyrophosphokinase
MKKNVNLKKAILVVNGRKPSKKIIEKLLKINYSTMIAADGGANFLYEMGIIPDIIIGDLDSVSEVTSQKIKKPTLLIKLMRQSDTDVEKAIKYLIKNKFTHVALIGVDGNRIDHLLGNLSIGLKYFKRIVINIISGKSIISFVGSSTIISTKKDDEISIFSFEENGIISSQGLKYSLDGLSLLFGQQDSISNIALNSEMKLDIKSGKFMVVRPLKSFFVNDNS